MRLRVWQNPADHVVLRAVLALLLTALLAFVLVGAASVVIARRIATESALGEATRSAETMGRITFAPLLPRALAGDRTAARALDQTVRTRQLGGALVRLKVWNDEGVVLYSDAHALVGRRFPRSSALRNAFERSRASAEVSPLDADENIEEAGSFDELVEVYVPLRLDDQRLVALEIYSTDERLVSAESQLRARLTPFALIALLVLVVLQLPVALWLVGRVGRAQRDRTRWLTDSLTASGRERRVIARDLHDGVVQSLAGAGYALEAAMNALPAGVTDHTRQLIDLGRTAVLDSVSELRNVMATIEPSELTITGLAAAIDVVADRVRTAGIETEVTVAMVTEPGPAVAATLYRAAREALTNVLKHAGAERVTVALTEGDTSCVLRVVDDGAGAPESGYIGARGHLGLGLLASAAADLGGRLSIGPGPQGGTLLELELPLPTRTAERFTIG